MPTFVDVEREVTDETSYDSYLLAEELAKSVESELGPSRQASYGALSSADGKEGGECKEAVAERKITEVLTTREREVSAMHTWTCTCAYIHAHAHNICICTHMHMPRPIPTRTHAIAGHLKIRLQGRSGGHERRATPGLRVLQ